MRPYLTGLNLGCSLRGFDRPYLCAALQQLLGDVDLAVDGRQVEARSAGGVPGVGVGAHLEQVRHRLLGALPR